MSLFSERQIFSYKGVVMVNLLDMIHHSKNCATLSIVQDKDLFTSNKELVLKLKRLDFLSNQSWAAHKGCLLLLGE